MTLSRPAFRALAAAGALAIVLTACGGDGDDDAKETTTTTAAEQTTTTAEETTTTTEAGRKGGDPDRGDDPDEGGEGGEEGGGDEDARAIAESVILTDDDFTSDWSSEPADEGDDELNQCWSDVDLDSDPRAEVDGDAFGQEGGSDVLIGVSSTALVLSDEETAEALVAETRTNAWAGCALDQLVASFEEDGLSVEDADLSPADGVGTAGDETSVLNGYFTLSSGDETYEGEVSLWFIRTGDVVTGFNVFDIGDTEFATVVDQVADIVADKHAAL